VNPDAVELGLGEAPHRVGRGSLYPGCTHGLEVGHRDRGVLDSPAPVRLGVGGVAAPEHDDILVAHERAPALDVGHDCRAAAGGQREVHGCRFAVRFSLRLVEVGVPVEEEKPVTAAPPERQKRAEEDRAVAAQHHRELVQVDDGADGIGERNSVVGNAARVEHQGLEVAFVLVSRRLDATGAAGAEPVSQTRGKQRIG
jgi:hypothetical protein